MSDETKVVPIFPELEITKAKSGRKCPGRHMHIELDEKLRTATCLRCGYSVDPFDHLVMWATEGNRMAEALKGLRHGITIAQAEHDDLMRKIRNMRATLKRNGAPQPQVERRFYDTARINPANADEYLFKIEKP